MKIAMIGQKGIPAQYGGVERHVHDLSVHLAAEGHDVTVYSRRWYTGGRKTPVQGARVQHIPSIHTKHLDTVTHVFLATIHAIRQNFDVIHYHGVGPAIFSWIPRVLAPHITVVTTFHSIDRYHQKWNVFAKWVLRRGEFAACAFAHKTIAVSQSLRQYCLNEFGAETEYIPNGVNAIDHAVLEKTLAAHNLKKNEYMVMVSRLVPHKGAHILIEAFKRFKKQHAKNPRAAHVKLVIVGGSAHTDRYVASLRLAAAEHDDIVFTGFQSGRALEELYANALALVHPSFNEGLPLTVLQAMSYGKPALLSGIPEHMELTQDARVLFKENSVKSLENALTRFINLDARTRQSIGRINKRVTESEYAWGVLVPKVVNVYETARVPDRVFQYKAI